MSATNDTGESPTVWISFDENPADGTCVHEGRYVPDGLLPFDVEDCNGIHFTMDGVVCELLGDLGGHAVYRRRRHTSNIQTMNWEDFAEARADGIIELHNNY